MITMAIVNTEGYVMRRTTKEGRKTKMKAYRNWWLVKHKSAISGYIPIGYINLPKEMVGSRVRLKVEIMEDD